MRFACSVPGLLALALFATVAMGQDLVRDPMGEKAHYNLDKNSARTSNMIKSGTMDLLVTKFLPDANPASYEVTESYDFDVRFVGRQTGAKLLIEPAEVFTEEFLVTLRETKYYESPNFKMKHLGFRDARNMDGRSYAHCDYVYIYDIVVPAKSLLADFASELILAAAEAQGIKGATKADIENLQMWAHIQYGIPVIGAVKMDIAGVVNGFNIKAGTDYVPPRQ